MKKLILLLILPLTLIIAQSKEEEKPIDLTGKFALMFQIDQNFDLNGFDGKSFSGKYYYNELIGLRLSFSAFTNDENDFAEDETFPTDYGSWEVRTNKNNIYSISFNFLFNILRNEDFIAYIGAGPVYSFYSSESTREVLDNLQKTKNEVEGYGAQAIIGFEWFVMDNLSLSGEYGFKYVKDTRESTSSEYQNERIIRTITYENNETIFSDLPVNLGVSIYF